jgi:predicted Rossmann fold flavoprotein
MNKYDVAVIGGGAAGIVAAISAKRSGKSVVICERLPKLGKKILASGNGRCNLANVNIDASCYNRSARGLAGSVLSRFGKDDMIRFFSSLGLVTYSEEGRIFPVTNQASSVLKVLEMEIERLGIAVEPGFEAVDVSRSGSGFIVRSRQGKSVSCGKVILAGGGRSYPALGSNGSLYALAGKFGHSIIEPVPSAVALEVKDKLCHLLQGQKIFASVKGIVDDKIVSEARGDLLFTKYGLSGTAIIDVSEEISVAVNRLKKKNVSVAVDMAPFIDMEALKIELSEKVKKVLAPEDIIAGLLPNKFGPALIDTLRTKDPEKITGAIKDKRFNVTATRGWNEAEFTAGGVAVGEVDPVTLESKLQKGIYFAGEILDVSGKRGGYNLAWAWASGWIVGLAHSS